MKDYKMKWKEKMKTADKLENSNSRTPNIEMEKYNYVWWKEHNRNTTCNERQI